MPDISMCLNKNCPLRMKCYRYTAIPDDWQSFCGFAPDQTGKCDYFWDNAGKRINPLLKEVADDDKAKRV